MLRRIIDASIANRFLVLALTLFAIGAGIDRLIDIENLEGSAFDDTLTGDVSGSPKDGRDILDGGNGVGAGSSVGAVGWVAQPARMAKPNMTVAISVVRCRRMSSISTSLARATGPKPSRGNSRWPTQTYVTGRA